MNERSSSALILRFGIYTLDEQSGELHRNGVKVRLADQPLQLLRLLVSRQGELLTREEIRAHLWPSDTFVAFDGGLNSAVRKLRDAIGDSADNPRFVETLPRRGYRFIAPVERVEIGTPPGRSLHQAGRLNRRAVVVAALALMVVSTASTLQFTRPDSPESSSEREAEAAYRQGLLAAGQRTADGYLKAVKYLESAVAWQPDFAIAYSTLAQMQAQLLYVGALSPREVVPKAETAARKALELDDTIAMAHEVLGQILQVHYWRWEEGKKEFRRARELEARVVERHTQSGLRLIRSGRFNDGAAEIERARRADPRSPDALIAAAQWYRLAGQPDLAVAALRQAAEIEPTLARTRFLLGRLFLQMRNVNDAIADLESAVQLSGTNARFYACLGAAYAAAGRHADARRMVGELEARARREYVSAFGIALIYDALGEKAAALPAFERAYQDRAIELAQLTEYPPFKTIASDPTFQNRLQTIGRPLADGTLPPSNKRP